MKSSHISLRKRLIGITVLVMTALLVLFAAVLFVDRSQLMEAKQEKLRNLVESTHGVVSHFEQAAREGRMSMEEAQKAASDAVRGMRYDKVEYFWINDMTAKVVMHAAKPELDGKDMSQLKDPNGKLLFNEFVAVVKKDGAGFVDYLWPKPGFDKPVQKVSYVKGFAPWGWVIGSGVYIDDVNAAFEDAAIRLALWAIGIGAIIAVSLRLLYRNLFKMIGGEPDEAAGIAHRIAGGDLSTPIAVRDGCEDSLLAGMQKMQDSLRVMISEVTGQAAQLSGSAEMLNYAADQVLTRSQSQSESAQAIAAAIEEMTTSIALIAQSAHDAHSITVESGSFARDGSDIIQQASDEIHRLSSAVHSSSVMIQELERHSNDINSIVNTIKEIADQTNLLALNAAIEAARAGEQGRGFAVVADEVRKLAERTTTSTSEIAGMITRIQEGTRSAVQSMTAGETQATEGVALANKAGASITQIRDSAQRVTDVVTAISDSIREQSTATNEISRSIERIAEMSEDGASEVSHTVGAAQELQGMSQALNESVSRFRL